MAGIPEHEPTEKSRAEVSALTSFGVRQDEIAIYLDIDPKTLRKHYRRELDTGKIKGNAAIARRLYKAAIDEGSVPAMIFWMKAQAGWREKQDINHISEDGSMSPTRIELVAPGNDPDSES